MDPSFGSRVWSPLDPRARLAGRAAGDELAGASSRVRVELGEGGGRATKLAVLRAAGCWLGSETKLQNFSIDGIFGPSNWDAIPSSYLCTARLGCRSARTHGLGVVLGWVAACSATSEMPQEREPSSKMLAGPPGRKAVGIAYGLGWEEVSMAAMAHGLCSLHENCLMKMECGPDFPFGWPTDMSEQIWY